MRLVTFILMLLTSCNRQTKTNVYQGSVAVVDTAKQSAQAKVSEHHQLQDTTIKFLWIGNKYDERFKDTFKSIFLNDDYCRNIPDPARAALGYVATFKGNECSWDGDAKKDRSNLKCRILDALNLGYQCSEQHLGFLRGWFKNDPKALQELKDCPTEPDGSTIQETFNEIMLTVKGNSIAVWFSASGMNGVGADGWSWTETDYFQAYKDHIKLVRTDKSQAKIEHHSSGGN